MRRRLACLWVFAISLAMMLAVPPGGMPAAAKEKPRSTPAPSGPGSPAPVAIAPKPTLEGLEAFEAHDSPPT